MARRESRAGVGAIEMEPIAVVVVVAILALLVLATEREARR